MKSDPISVTKTDELYQKIYESIGAASVCWENVGEAGVFNTEMACKIAAELTSYICQEISSHQVAPSDFRSQLTELINRYSQERGSDTPDFILAGYLLDCLEAFNKATVARNSFYRGDSNSQSPGPLDFTD